MKAIKTTAFETITSIQGDRILTLQLPPDIQPGEHHIFVIISECPQIENTSITNSIQSKADIHAAITAYAAEHAGTSMDIDYELEEAGIECLNGNEKEIP